jgi:RNA binding exosome subunit
MKDNNIESNLQFVNSTIDIVIHATEDKSKIVKSVLATLEIPREKFEEFHFEGHWGNKILRVITEINKKETHQLIEKILTKLTYIDRQNLLTNLDQYIDEKGSLYLRLDKQKICHNKISLSDSEGIKIKFKVNKNKIILHKQSGDVEHIIYFSYRRLIQTLEK